MDAVRRTLRIVRKFLFSRTNREFLIFLFFIALSGIFWLLMTLNEIYEQEVKVPVRITGVPEDIMLTSEETDTAKVTIRDRGIVLLTYLYGDVLKNVSANFKTYDEGMGNGIASVSTGELTKLVSQYLASTSKVTAVKPERLLFYYNTGASKRVPVRWKGRVIPEQLYYLSQVTYDPDSVTIYAAEETLDSIWMVYTEPLNHVGFRDTLEVYCKLRKIEGVKMVPDHVTTTFFTDVLTEESIDGIPVEGINMPKGKILRTFPAKVSVRFVTGVNVFRTLSTKDFTVVADYNDFNGKPSEKCTLRLQKVPQGITRAKLVTTQVDYLIEEISE